MPTVIGNFISRHVYDSKLITRHAINTLTCCRFVDVSDGEEAKKGVSWMVSVYSTRHEAVIGADARQSRTKEK